MLKEGLAIAKATIGIIRSEFSALWAMAVLPYLVFVMIGIVGLGQWPGAHVVSLTGQSLVNVVYSAALLRAMIRGTPFSKSVFRFGTDEWRLIAFTCAFFGVATLIALGLSQLRVPFSMMIEAISLIFVTIAFGVIFFMGFFYAMFRFMVVGVILIAFPNVGLTRCVVVGWRQTQGHVGKMVVAGIVLFVPIVLVQYFTLYAVEKSFPDTQVLTVCVTQFFGVVSTAVSMIWSFQVYQTLAQPPETR
ncbi:hypothetical protein V5T82_16480 [Magnetovibrio sp. PR-2]|uniref:hypothetical protein n=1 Tax=Magnetovibrio sp. PR-2 TaxID=3120356 RepID=UPI002FCE232A